MAIIIDLAGDSLARTANLPAITEWTTCFWFFYNAAPATQQDFCIIVPTSGNAGLAITAGSVLRVRSAALTANLPTLTTGTWQFLALRQLSNNARGYHITPDGTLTTADLAVTPTGTISRANWGGNTGNSNFVDGRLFAIKFWDVGLSDSEVVAERLTILPKRLDSLNEFWPCFPGATERLAGYSKARDFTGNGTLTDGDPPSVGWGADPILIHPAGAAAAPVYTLTKFRVYTDDGSGL